MSKPAAQASPTTARAGREGRGRSAPSRGSTAGTQRIRSATCGDDPPQLAEALDGINNLAETAREAEDPVPSSELRDVAATQLRRLYSFAPFTYGVSSAPDGAIDIFARPKLGHSIALSLFSDGEVLCAVLVPDDEFSVSFSTVDGFTDEVLLKAGGMLKSALGQA